MEIWLWAVIGILLLVLAVLLIKIILLKKSAKEIEEAFTDRLITDTNTLIDISSHDRHMRRLASSINMQLRLLREKRHRFIQGDAELKRAITNISHDLRTPLTAICGYLDLLEQEEVSDTVRRYIEIIQNRTGILKQLTEELFRYSVLLTADENIQRESVVINSILEESIAAFYAAFQERGITPDIRLCEEKVPRFLDRAALSRVFANLITNALKYSNGDLKITLSETGEILFSNRASGLNEVQVGKLFDRFYTVEAARNSTGLGLTITKTLVEQMGGAVTAAYDNGRLVICIYFPESSSAPDL